LLNHEEIDQRLINTERVMNFKRNIAAGLGVIVPLGLAVYVLLKLGEVTRPLMVPLFGRNAPVVGLVLALLVVYLIGFSVTSLLGQFFVRKAEHLLARYPGARGIYNVWKEMFLNPPEQEGASLRVVLIPDEEGQRQMIAFTTGKPVPGDEGAICVFVPDAPNPMQGGLFLIPRERVQFSEVKTSEVYKLIVSKGRYLPEGLGKITG
jgi:uncharacterized membrane protein